MPAFDLADGCLEGSSVSPVRCSQAAGERNVSVDILEGGVSTSRMSRARPAEFTPAL
jgi:hypothetical protein